MKILAQLAGLLRQSNLKLITVESCTGGGLGKAISAISGCSEWYEGGYITYSNQAKNKWVNVPMSLIEKQGAVSLAVAEAMAKGGADSFPNCVSVAVTGIAGPNGGTASKPVGTVCIAASVEGQLSSSTFFFHGGREAIREQSIKEAFGLLVGLLKNKPE